jgi:hypothetical protein
MKKIKLSTLIKQLQSVSESLQTAGEVIKKQRAVMDTQHQLINLFMDDKKLEAMMLYRSYLNSQEGN